MDEGREAFALAKNLGLSHQALFYHRLDRFRLILSAEARFAMQGSPTNGCYKAALVDAVPYLIHTALTDNGIQFADLPKNRKGPTAMLRGISLIGPASATASRIS